MAETFSASPRSLNAGCGDFNGGREKPETFPWSVRRHLGGRKQSNFSILAASAPEVRRLNGSALLPVLWASIAIVVIVIAVR